MFVRSICLMISLVGLSPHLNAAQPCQTSAIVFTSGDVPFPLSFTGKRYVYHTSSVGGDRILKRGKGLPSFDIKVIFNVAEAVFGAVSSVEIEGQFCYTRYDVSGWIVSAEGMFVVAEVLYFPATNSIWYRGSSLEIDGLKMDSKLTSESGQSGYHHHYRLKTRVFQRNESGGLILDEETLYLVTPLPVRMKNL